MQRFLKSVLILLSLTLIAGLSVGFSYTRTKGPGWPLVTAAGDQKYPTLAYNTHLREYLLVYSEGARLRAQRLFPFGYNLGRPFTLYVSRTGQATGPALFYNPQLDEYLVVFNDAGNLVNLRLDSNGSPTFGRPWAFARGVGSDVEPAVDFVPQEGIYLAAWSQGSTLYTQRLDTNGRATLGRPDVVADDVGVPTAPALFFGQNGQFGGEHLIVYNTGHSLKARRLFPQGQVVSSRGWTVAEGVTAQARPAFSSNMEGERLLIWNQRR